MLWLKEWLTGVIAAAILLSLVYRLIPGRAPQRVARLSGGVILLLAIVQPLMEVDPAALRLQYEGYQQALEEQITFYREENREELLAIIEEESGAYISEKTAEMGYPCRAEVRAVLAEDRVILAGVTLDRPRREEVSRWLEEEMGLEQAAQSWEVVG